MAQICSVLINCKADGDVIDASKRRIRSRMDDMLGSGRIDLVVPSTYRLAQAHGRAAHA